MFDIRLENWYWIDKSKDNPEDFCLHGDFALTIGGETVRDSYTVSTGALYLLRSLKTDHIMPETADADPGWQKMLPCCGFSMFPQEDGTVMMIGCPYGTDFSVRHEGDAVRLTSESGAEETVPLAEYRRAVLAFADSVKAAYAECTPKARLDSDPYGWEGYLAFWREFDRLRAEW